MRLTGVFILFISWVVSTAHPGVGIVEDSKGNIFFTDLKQVWKIDLLGKKSIAVPQVHTHELYMDESDNLLGEHLWYNGDARKTWGYYVWKLTADGGLSKVIPDTEGFIKNYSFVRDRSGNMFWANREGNCQQVIKRNSNKNASHGDACFHNIRFMRSTQNNELLVVDFQDIKRISQNGKVTTIASKIADPSWEKSSIENQNSVMGIWDDAQGNIYTAITATREVKKFLPDGRQEVIRKTAFPWAPSGGMISKKGELWVLEVSFTNSVRVVRITSKDIKLY